MLLTGVEPEQFSTAVTSLLREAGACNRLFLGDRVRIRCGERLRASGVIRTSPYPGFPTDAQPVVMAAMCLSRGTTMFRGDHV